MCFILNNKLFFTWSLLFGLSTINSLKITYFHVPREASNNANLICRYDLEGDTLYDVKWFKDDENFFRCMLNGQTHAYERIGITHKIVDSKYSKPGSCNLHLINLDSQSAGVYRCDVTTEAPTFKSDARLDEMKVVRYPDEHLISTKLQNADFEPYIPDWIQSHENKDSEEENEERERSTFELNDVYSRSTILANTYLHQILFTLQFLYLLY